MKKFLFFIFLSLISLQFGYSQMYAYEFDIPRKEYFYILADGVRIRSQPNLNGEIIGRLSVNSRIKIISKPEQERPQVIDGVSGYWYLIEYENLTGYIWGGNIAAHTLVFDIDNNGIDDYFHTRVSVGDALRYTIDSRTDIFIYINNIKIPTTDIVSKHPIYNHTRHTWGDGYFKLSERNTVLLNMYISDHGYMLDDFFEIDEKGNITFLEQIETFSEDNY